MGKRTGDIAEIIPTDEPFLSLKALARRLRITEKTAREMRDAGTIKPLPIGRGRYLYSQVMEQIKSANQ